MAAASVHRRADPGADSKERVTTPAGVCKDCHSVSLRPRHEYDPSCSKTLAKKGRKAKVEPVQAQAPVQNRNNNLKTQQFARFRVNLQNWRWFRGSHRTCAA